MRVVAFAGLIIITCGALTPASSAPVDEAWQSRSGQTIYPRQYCLGNRSMLPPTQQKICSDHDQKKDLYGADVWQPRPGEAYNPSTYCSWNRSGLPPAQQKICDDRDQKYGVYKSNWRRIEADNGAVYAIDMNSIAHNTNGSADAVMCIVDNKTCAPGNMRRLLFDCQGHYMDIDNGGSTMLIAPPRSVVGQIAVLACAGAKDSRLEDASRGDQRGLTPAEYCVGFSHEACDRIKKVVEAKTPPSFCKPGFGLVGSGLTSEQLRICYVMSSPAFH